MAVTSLLNELQPGGPLGPPTIMLGFQTLAGDVSGGTSTISFVLPPGFLYMLTTLAFGTASNVDINFNVRLENFDDQVANARLSRSGVITAPGASLGSFEMISWPRILVRTVQRTPTIDFICANTNGITHQLYLRVLRWPANAAPEALIAFLTAPP